VAVVAIELDAAGAREIVVKKQIELAVIVVIDRFGAIEISSGVAQQGMAGDRIHVYKLAVADVLVDLGGRSVGAGDIQIELAVIVEVDKFRAIAFTHVLRTVRTSDVAKAERMGRPRFD